LHNLHFLVQITTNQLNGALLRAVLSADIVNDERIRNHVDSVGEMMEDVAEEYDVELRGRGMNRGIFTEDPEKMEIAQFALLINRGILVGALPSTIRFQPCILEDKYTIELLMRSTLDEWEKVKNGDISVAVQEAVDESQKMTGLNTPDK
jgi:acetylornithine/succinyldiaminopimelate/putrescine aminotransferase